MIHTHSLKRILNFPTRGANYLDLFFCNEFLVCDYAVSLLNFALVIIALCHLTYFLMHNLSHQVLVKTPNITGILVMLITMPLNSGYVVLTGITYLKTPTVLILCGKYFCLKLKAAWKTLYLNKQ